VGADLRGLPTGAEVARRIGPDVLLVIFNDESCPAEVIMWLVIGGALEENVNVVHKHYHAPISNTGAGVLVLENTFI
jgi:hypothetical protein